MEGADGHEVQGVAASLQVVLLELEPVERTLGRLVRGVHGLDDETLGVVGDGILEEYLELLDVARDLRRAKVKLVRNLVESTVHRLPSLRQRLLQERLAVEVEAVEGVDAHVDLDVSLVDVLATARGQNLKRENLVVLPVVRHSLSVDHHALHPFFQVGRQPSDDVRELRGVILLVPGEDLDGAVLQEVDLRPLPVVLVLARKLHVRKPLEHLAHAAGGLGEHGLDGHAGPEVAPRVELIHTAVHEQRGDDLVVGGALGEGLLEDVGAPTEQVGDGAVAALLRSLGRGVGLENHGVDQSLVDGLLREADAELALQRSHDVASLALTRGDEQLFDLGLFCVDGFVPFGGGDGAELLEHAGHGELRGREHGLLRAPAPARHDTQVALLLVVSPYGALLAAGGFGEDLHQRRVANAQVDALVLRRDGVAREVHGGE